MSGRETVTQMVDKFQAIEKQKVFTKDEEIRSLSDQCKKMAETIREKEYAYHNVQIQRDKAVIDLGLLKDTHVRECNDLAKKYDTDLVEMSTKHAKTVAELEQALSEKETDKTKLDLERELLALKKEVHELHEEQKTVNAQFMQQKVWLTAVKPVLPN
jgi:hypothetical protein